MPTAVGYMPQADPSGNCCDCPERESPCDDCTCVYVCDSISASLTKCGFAGDLCTVSCGGDHSKFYLTRSFSGDWTIPNCSTGSFSYVVSFDPLSGCNNITIDDCSGSSTDTNPSDPDPHSYSLGIHDDTCQWYDDTAAVIVGGNDFMFGHCTPTLGAPIDTCEGTGLKEHYNVSGGGTAEHHCAVSVEYTTALLISTTISALPAYDGDYDDTCYSFRNLSDDGTTYTIQRFKFKQSFAASLIDRTIYWTETFTPEVGSPVDTDKSDTVLAGATQYVHEVLEPSTDGTTTISCPSFSPP